MAIELLRRLRIPVVCAPMFLISGPDLVLAACKAGIIGAFPTPNARPISILDEWMSKITEGLAAARAADPQVRLGPWAANLVTHSSNTRLPDDLVLVAQYKPPIVITALGSPRPVIDVVHSYGGIVLADVTNLTLARKAVAAGADGLACVCSGAGGHTGTLSPFAFVSAVREFFDGIVVIGGGISDGWGIAGAIAAGADLVYMGTRFLATAESQASDAYKQMVVDCDSDDLLISSGITGTTASWLKPSLVANGIDPATLVESSKRHYDSNTPLSKKRWMDVWAAGQGLGVIRDVPPVAGLVGKLEREYRNAGERFAAFQK